MTIAPSVSVLPCRTFARASIATPSTGRVIVRFMGAWMPESTPHEALLSDAQIAALPVYSIARVRMIENSGGGTCAPDWCPLKVAISKAGRVRITRGTQFVLFLEAA